MRLIAAVVASGFVAAAAPAAALSQAVDRSGVTNITPARESAPGVDVWLDEISFRFGDRVRPFVASETGSYLTVIRVTTDGELRVLYPRRPSEQRPFEQARFVNDRLPYSGDQAFNLYESSGMGFIFAIASYRRFDYSYYSSGSQWSIARLATSRYGDPFAIVSQFVSRTLPETADFSMDYVSYEVYSTDRTRSRYANRYATYYGAGDYFDLCLSSFGIGYSDFCRSYGIGYFGPGYHGSRYRNSGRYGSGYGPVIGYPGTNPRNPGTPGTTIPRVGMRVKPMVPDPVVPNVPLDPVPAEGRLDPRRAADARRMSDIRERAMKRNGGRVTTDPIVDPRVSSPEQPRIHTPEPVRVYRPEPRMRPEPRSEPRAMPQTPARVEIRNDPPPAPRVDQPAQGRVYTPRSEPRIIRQEPVARENVPPPEKQ